VVRWEDLLSRCGKVSIVHSSRVLDRHFYAVIASASFAKVVILEVERSLGESVAVGKVMDSVDDIESICTSRVDIGGG